MIGDGGHIQTRIFEAWACVEAMRIPLQMRAQCERKYRLSTWYSSVGFATMIQVLVLGAAPKNLVDSLTLFLLCRLRTWFWSLAIMRTTLTLSGRRNAPVT